MLWYHRLAILSVLILVLVGYSPIIPGPSTWLIQALKKRVIKIGRKNKTEDGQVETESQPDDKDDKKNLIFPTKTKKGIFARLRKWLFFAGIVFLLQRDFLVHSNVFNNFLSFLYMILYKFNEVSTIIFIHVLRQTINIEYNLL